MEEWKTYKLGEVINIASGGTPEKGNNIYWSGDIPWISAKSMYNDFISTSDSFITKEGLDNGSKIASKDSILLLTRGSGLFNRIPVCYTLSDVAYNQDVKNISVKVASITSNKFLFYWMYGNKQLISSMLETTGIGAGKIDTKRLLNLDIAIPPLTKQERLINIAEAIFNKIELNRRINDNLEQQAQALYKSWFVDFEPFKDGNFVDSELGLIPEGFSVIKVGDICSSISDSSNLNKKRLIFLNTGDISKGEFLHSNFTDVSDMPGQAKKTIRKNDILYSEIRPINKHYAYVNFESYNHIVSTKLMVLRTRKFNSRRLYQYLTSDDIIAELQIEAESRSGTFPQIRFDNIQRLSICVGTNEVEDIYSKIIGNIYSIIDKNIFENQNLANLRDTLLPKLMSGELKINDLNS